MDGDASSGKARSRRLTINTRRARPRRQGGLTPCPPRGGSVVSIWRHQGHARSATAAGRGDAEGKQKSPSPEGFRDPGRAVGSTIGRRRHLGRPCRSRGSARPAPRGDGRQRTPKAAVVVLSNSASEVDSIGDAALGLVAGSAARAAARIDPPGSRLARPSRTPAANTCA